MFKYEATYKDFDGVEQKDTFYFNLNQAELIELQAKYPGGLKSLMERIIESKDQMQIIPVIKEIVLMSYGVRTPESKYFMKTEEERKKFECCPAYSDLFSKLCTDEQFALDFIDKITPSEESLIKGA